MHRKHSTKSHQVLKKTLQNGARDFSNISGHRMSPLYPLYLKISPVPRSFRLFSNKPARRAYKLFSKIFYCRFARTKMHDLIRLYAIMTSIVGSYKAIMQRYAKH